MDSVQKTETQPDIRDQIGGYPLPWKVVDRDRMGGDLVDDDGEVITNFGDDEFYVDLAAGVNRASARIAALTSALVSVVNAYWDRTHGRSLSPADRKVFDIINKLGLADRVWGNPTEADEAVS